MSWFDRYNNDTDTKWTAIFIIVFLILFTIAAPYWWYISLIALVGYVALFYFERNNK